MELFGPQRAICSFRRQTWENPNERTLRFQGKFSKLEGMKKGGEKGEGKGEGKGKRERKKGERGDRREGGGGKEEQKEGK